MRRWFYLKTHLLSSRTLTVTYVLLIIIANLFILVLGRQHYLSGWGLPGAADGVWFSFQEGLWEALLRYWPSTRSYQYWATWNSAIFPVASGFLAFIFPSLYWLSFFNCLTFWLAVFYAARKLGYSNRIVLACLAASPVVLCFSLETFPYMSSFLPYGLALLLTLKGPLAKGLTKITALIEIIGWIFAFELAFHCYELGKTWLLVPAIGSLTLRNITRRRRAGWLAVSLVSGYLYFFTASSTISRRASDLIIDWESAFMSLWVIIRGLVVHQYSDLPILALLVVIFAVIARGRNCRGVYWFWIFLLLSHGAMLLGEALVEGLSLESGGLRPRRFILINVLASLFIGSQWQAASNKGKYIASSALAIGHIWTLYISLQFYITPPLNRSLPYVHSPADFYISRDLIDDAKELARRSLSSVAPTYLVYGYSNYYENTTDPGCLPERILLELGPFKFFERIRFIDLPKCRYSCLPMHSVSSAKEELKAISSPTMVYFPSNRADYLFPYYAHKSEGSLLSWLGVPYIRKSDFDLRMFRAYQLLPQVEILHLGEDNELIEKEARNNEQVACEVVLPFTPLTSLKSMEFADTSTLRSAIYFPIERYFSSQETRYYVSLVNNISPSHSRIILKGIADDEIIVVLNDNTIGHYLHEFWPPIPFSIEGELRPGLNQLEIFFSNVSAEGLLRISLEHASELSFECPPS